LHTYTDGRIGETVVASPLILGHEFAGIVEECGAEAVGGTSSLLTKGMHVAVDPATPCYACEMCKSGNPHLCVNLHFCGNFPDDGCLCERMIVPAKSCFPLPRTLENDSAALLEPLGVAIHAIRLADLTREKSVCILGGGPIGLMILQLVRRVVAGPVYVTEPLPWRLTLAEQLGATPINPHLLDPVTSVLEVTRGRGVDVAIEAAWADETVQQAAEIARPGGRVVLVGIAGDDRLRMKHSTGRRKELAVLFSRRMKHTYPEAITLVKDGSVDLRSLISHRFSLAKAPDAFALNAAYQDGVVKVIITN
jgi:L-iditol 2-dehydrogenase